MRSVAIGLVAQKGLACDGCGNSSVFLTYAVVGHLYPA